MGPYKIKIGLVSDILDVEYTDQIIDIEFSENSMDSLMSLESGIIEQYVDVTIQDKNGYLLNLILNMDIYDIPTTLLVFCIDTYNNTEQLLDTYEVSKWDVDIENSSITIHATDPSNILDNVTIPVPSIETRSVDQLLQIIFNYIGYEYTYIGNAQTICSNIIIPDNWYWPSSARDLLNKVLNLAFMRCYWNGSAFAIMEVLS